MVDFRIIWTRPMNNQPPKSPNPPSPPCQGGNSSGGLHEALIRGTIGERLHIYIVHHKLGYQSPYIIVDLGINETLQTEPYCPQTR